MKEKLVKIQQVKKGAIMLEPEYFKVTSTKTSVKDEDGKRYVTLRGIEGYFKGNQFYENYIFRDIAYKRLRNTLVKIKA